MIRQPDLAVRVEHAIDMIARERVEGLLQHELRIEPRELRARGG